MRWFWFLAIFKVKLKKWDLHYTKISILNWNHLSDLLCFELCKIFLIHGDIITTATKIADLCVLKYIMAFVPLTNYYTNMYKAILHRKTTYCVKARENSPWRGKHNFCYLKFWTKSDSLHFKFNQKWEILFLYTFIIQW